MYLATYMKSATVYSSRRLWAICEPSCSSTHAQFSTQQQFMKHFAEVKQIKMIFLSWSSKISLNCEMQTLDNLLSYIFSLWVQKLNHFGSFEKLIFTNPAVSVGNCATINMSTAWVTGEGGSSCLRYTL